MNYKELWTRLKNEVTYLCSQRVSSVNPYIILGYMSFLEEIERGKEMPDKQASQTEEERTS